MVFFCEIITLSLLKLHFLLFSVIHQKLLRDIVVIQKDKSPKPVELSFFVIYEISSDLYARAAFSATPNPVTSSSIISFTEVILVARYALLPAKAYPLSILPR
jgi:hypothetical protein